MQNIATLISSPTDGKAIKSTNPITGPVESPVDGVSDAISDQNQSFQDKLTNFLEGNNKSPQSFTDPSSQSLTKLVLQELPQDGNILPTGDVDTSADIAAVSEMSINELKQVLKDLATALSDFNNDTHIPADQKTSTEKLAAQLTELQHLLQESDGANITIPASLANGILNNIQSLRDAGILEARPQGTSNQTTNLLVSALTDQPDKTPQTASTHIHNMQSMADKGNNAVAFDDSKLDQLSNFVQKLTSDIRSHTPVKSDVALSGLLKASTSQIDAKGGDTLIGNITGSFHHTGNPVGDRAVTNLPINSPFNQSTWGDEVGDRIKWMVGQNIQSAKLTLNPPQLGPIEVKITVQNDQMNVMFTAHHAAVRDALESAVPRLREMFGDSGLNLADVDVSQQSFSDQHRASPEIDTSYYHDDNSEHINELSHGSILNQRISLHQGLVDFYA